MAHDKQFKDPIYGYISIDSDLVSNIIDTPAFQRLKDIRQTSYTPLFPAAYHNRFVHSLGVYYLGRIAFRAIAPQLSEELQKINSCLRDEAVRKVFELACLLHDIGHAPFSHTGENFFIDKADTLYWQLKNCVQNPGFSADFDALGTKKPAPHECMSCVVGLCTFPQYFDTVMERNLFARCIIGLPFRLTEKEPEFSPDLPVEERKATVRQYNEFRAHKTEIELLNCVISLLNSSIIDVDRLDYIIRDASTIGFKNAQIDYTRLLNGMRIVEYGKSMCIGYHKSALSVIESAVYAHDAERKWIQGHPSILYEMEALKNAMSALTNRFATAEDPNPLFCYEALTERGKDLCVPLFTDKANDLQSKGNLFTPSAQEVLKAGNLFSSDCYFDTQMGTLIQRQTISLLADEDILHLMKRFCRDGLAHEYFARNDRRVALWKSEAEFRALFQERIGDESTAIKTLESNFEGLVNYCQEKTGCPVVNSELFSILDCEESDANQAKCNGEIPDDMYNDIISSIHVNRHWTEVLGKLSDELELEFNYLIIFQKKFSSSFKPTIGKIPVLFPNLKDDIVPLENVIDVLKSGSDRRSNFFHLFYKPQGRLDPERKKQIVNTIARRMIEEIQR